MKQIILNEDEMKAVWEELRKVWITMENQVIVFKLLQRIERELEN